MNRIPQLVFIVLFFGCGSSSTDTKVISDNSSGLYKTLNSELKNNPDSVLSLLDDGFLPGLSDSAEYRQLLISCYFKTNQYQRALNELEKLQLQAVDNDSLSRAALKQKSIALYRLGDFRSFIRETRRVYVLDTAAQQYEQASRCLSNIAAGYHELGLFDSSLRFMNLALNEANKSHDTSLIHLQQRRFIPVLLELGDLDSAESILMDSTSAMQLSEVDQLMDLINYGSILNKRKKYAESRDIYEKAFNLAVEIGDSADIALVLNNLAYADYHTGYYRRGFQRLDSAIDINDELREVAFASNIHELELKYEDLKKDAQLADLESQTEADAVYKRWIIGISVLIVSFLLGLFLVMRGRLQAIRKLREEEQKRFQKEKELTALHSSMQALEEERKRVAMDLHDGIGVLASAARIRVSQVNNRVKDEELNKILSDTDEVLDEITSDVRRIAHNIMPSTLSKLGLKAAIEELVDRTKDSPDIQFKLNLDDVKLPSESNIEITIYRIIQELVNNGLKHSQATEISIALKSSKKILLTYIDNGVGLNQQQKDSNGSGLNAMRSRIEYVGGKMTIDPKFEGTRIVFEIENE